MRPLGYLIILIGCVLLLLAARDQRHGSTSVIAPGRSVLTVSASRSENPQEFHNLMTYQWIRGLLLLGLGAVIINICRSADRTDPFSPRFAGKDEVKALRRILDEEEVSKDTKDESHPNT